ncbi:MAG: hypothetical protein U1C33_05800 [Candidatus Cloacimonadaceae bacterium]|nr:hypothetical protein [Candidatus Cloacimonadaceae bacterium]
MRSTLNYKLLLVVLLPVAVAFLGGSFISGGIRQFFGFTGESLKGNIGLFEIYFGSSLLVGVVALLYRYLQTSYYWLGTLVLAVLYSLFISRNTVYGFSLFQIFLPVLVFSVLLSAVVVFVFYNRKIMHLRTMLTGILSALILTSFFRALFFIAKQPVEPGFWMNRFVSGLILFVLISFGLSIADTIIVKDEIKKLRESQLQRALDEEDEEAEYYQNEDDDEIDDKR